jgi:hypothetical protein
MFFTFSRSALSSWLPRLRGKNSRKGAIVRWPDLAKPTIGAKRLDAFNIAAGGFVQSKQKIKQ